MSLRPHHHLQKLFSPSARSSTTSTPTTTPMRRHLLRQKPKPNSSPFSRRYISSTPKPEPSPTSSSPQTTKTHARLTTLLNRLPRFLHPYTTSLRSAPVSNIVAFLILHEITAIVPLVGLAGAFHYTGWIPVWSWGRDGAGNVEERNEDGNGNGNGKVIERDGDVQEGVEKWGRFFKRKGWFGFGSDIDITPLSSAPSSSSSANELENDIAIVEERWNVSERGGRILVEVATAYAITKVLLPVRVVVSVWGTPWFAKVVVGRVGGWVERLRRGGK